MTHQLYIEQQLQAKSLTELKAIYTQIGASVETDKRCKSVWVNAIVAHQSSQIQKVDSPKSEHDVNFIDIDGFYNFEAQVNGEVIAELDHDAFNSSNPWYVSVAGIEVYRASQYSEATDWVKSQYMAGTLAKHQPTETVVLTDARVERALTIEVLEQHTDEFVVHNCENNHYYVVRPNHIEPNERCECADCHYRSVKCKHQIAVENFLGQRLEQVILRIAVSLDELLDIPFDELTSQDWERLKNYPAISESMELVAA